MISRKGTDQAVGNSADLIGDFKKFIGFTGAQITKALGDDQLRLDLQERTTSVSNRLDKFSSRNSSGSLRYIARHRDSGTPDLAGQPVKLMTRKISRRTVNQLTGHFFRTLPRRRPALPTRTQVPPALRLGTGGRF
jgi:hypothetical protein